MALEVKLKPYQDKYIYSQAKFDAMVAGWGTGKSLCGIVKGITLSQEHDNNLGVIFRKEFVDLQKSTMKDFESYTGLSIPSSKEVQIGKSKIMFLHTEELNNIQNINLGWFWIEQAEELETDQTFMTLFGRLRRKNTSRQGFLTANTMGHNWIWSLWKKGEWKKILKIMKKNPKYKDLKMEDLAGLVEAKTYDNADNLPDDFLMSLDVMKARKPKLYARLVMNSWEEQDIADVVIPYGDIEKSVEQPLIEKTVNRTVVVVDPARYGDDETVAYVFRNNQIIFQEIYSKKSTMETTGKVVLLKNRFNAAAIAGDVVGLGVGMFDRLSELGVETLEINSAKKSTQPEKYFNLRSEMWVRAADKFYGSDVSIPDDEVLKNQLGAVKYEVIESTGKMRVESKAKVKKRLGESPDRADACVMGLWAVDRVRITLERRTKERKSWSY